MELHKDMQELEVLVKFNAHNNKTNNEIIWCDNIELFINYDMLPKKTVIRFEIEGLDPAQIDFE